LPSALTRWQLELLSFLLRRGPALPGRWRLALRAIRLATEVGGLIGVRTVVTRLGFRMRVDGNSQAGRVVFATGDYEPEVADVVVATLRPGDVFVDVGAHIGYFTMLGAQCVGPTGLVLAFEASPTTAAELAHNVGLNGFENVQVRRDALSDESGTVEFFRGPAGNTGLGSLRADAGGLAHTVPAVRLDDVLEPGRRVSLIKIDVEGAEHRVLRGAESCLKRDRPEVVLELTDRFLRDMGSSAADLAEWMTGLGYRMFWLGWEGTTEADLPLRNGVPVPAQANVLFTTDTPRPDR